MRLRFLLGLLVVWVTPVLAIDYVDLPYCNELLLRSDKQEMYWPSYVLEGRALVEIQAKLEHSHLAKLSTGEFEALSQFAGSGDFINKEIDSGRSGEYAKTIRDLRALFQHAPKLPFDVIVYRGEGFELSKRQPYKVGEQFSSSRFMSTSLKPHKTTAFAGGSYADKQAVIYKIRLKKGQKAIYLPAQDLAYYKTKLEAELLLPEETTFKVTRSEKILVIENYRGQRIEMTFLYQELEAAQNE